jgi:hypothetical protein
LVLKGGAREEAGTSVRPTDVARGAEAAPEFDGRQSGVLVRGVCQAAVFVATEVLISADTLEDERAVRGWLAQHDIHVTPPRRQSRSTPRGTAGAMDS